MASYINNQYLVRKKKYALLKNFFLYVRCYTPIRCYPLLRYLAPKSRTCQAKQATVDGMWEHLQMAPTVKDGNVASPLWAPERDGPLHRSISNALVARVCLYGNKIKKQLRERTVSCSIICAELTLFYFLCRLKVNHTAFWTCVYSWEWCCRNQLVQSFQKAPDPTLQYS